MSTSVLTDHTRLHSIMLSGLMHKSTQDRAEHLACMAARLTHADVCQINIVTDDAQYTVCQWPDTLSLADRVRPARESGCVEVVRIQRPLAIEDTARHPLTCNMPWVTLYQSYLGVPIFHRNQPIGAICVLFGAPRDWSIQDRLSLQNVADLLMDTLGA